MEKELLVSVIMPAYNAQDFIAEAIVSVQQQSYPNWELLVIDDASVDQTVSIVEDFRKKDARIKLHKLPANQGAGFARNIGIKASEGQMISFLDADDRWKPFKIETQLKFMQEEKVNVSYSSYELIKEEGQSIQKKVKSLPELTFGKLLKANYVGNLTGMYNSAKLGKIYCPLIRKRQDWGLWLLVIRKGGTAKGVTEALAEYRIRKNSISSNKAELLKYNYQVYREVLGFSAVKSFFLMIMFLWEQFAVKSRQTSTQKGTQTA